MAEIFVLCTPEHINVDEVVIIPAPPSSPDRAALVLPSDLHRILPINENEPHSPAGLFIRERRLYIPSTGRQDATSATRASALLHSSYAPHLSRPIGQWIALSDMQAQAHRKFNASWLHRATDLNHKPRICRSRAQDQFGGGLVFSARHSRF